MASARRPSDEARGTTDLEAGPAPISKVSATKTSRLGLYRWLDTLYSTWGMDTRSLALYRICLAGVIVCDIFDRVTNLREHYSDEGYVPRRLAISAWELPSQICLHMANGTATYQGFLFFLQFVWAMALAAGYHTRLATLLCWYWNISLEMKNPIILHNGDVYLRMMLFWGIFLPLGHQWSLDRIRSGRSLPDAANANALPEDYRHLSWGGSVGSILQLHYVYTISVLHKYEAGYKIWFQEGSATYWAIKSLPYYWTGIGEWAASLDPAILRALTYAVLGFEFFGPFLLICPWKTHITRLIGIAGIFFLHFGFAMCLKLEEFVWIGCTASFCCIPSWIWDVWIPRLRAKGSHLTREIRVTYSDKYLPLAQVVETFFLLSNVKWVGEEAEADVRNGFAVTADGQTFHGPAALVVLFSHSPVLWPLGRLFLVGPFPAMLRGFFWTVAIGLGDNTEETVQRRGKRWHMSPEVREFLSYMFSLKIWLNVLGFFLVLYSYMWVGANVGIAVMPDSLRAISHPLMLYQSWQMFAPPPQHVYWHNIELRLKGGDHLELIKGGGLWRWEGVPWHDGPPEPLYPNYGNHRNWKWWETFNWHTEHNDVRLEFGRWICREWNSRHSGDKTLMNHKIHFASYPAETPKEQIMEKAVRQVMWDHSCF